MGGYSKRLSAQERNHPQKNIIMKMSKDSWSKIIHIIITILTAIATTVGVTSCTGYGPF